MNKIKKVNRKNSPVDIYTGKDRAAFATNIFILPSFSVVF